MSKIVGFVGDFDFKNNGVEHLFSVGKTITQKDFYGIIKKSDINQLFRFYHNPANAIGRSPYLPTDYSDQTVFNKNYLSSKYFRVSCDKNDIIQNSDNIKIISNKITIDQEFSIEEMLNQIILYIINNKDVTISVDFSNIYGLSINIFPDFNITGSMTLFSKNINFGGKITIQKNFYTSINCIQNFPKNLAVKHDVIIFTTTDISPNCLNLPNNLIVGGFLKIGGNIYKLNNNNYFKI